MSLVNPRKAAADILYRVYKNNAYLNVEMNKTRKENSFSDMDLKLINEITHGVIKNKIFLDYIIEKNSKIKFKKIAPYVVCVLECGLYQIMFTDKIPQSAAVNESVKIIKNSKLYKSAGFVNAILRNAARGANNLELPQDNAKKLSLVFSYPEWIVKNWLNEFGEDFTYELLIAFNEKSDLFLRCNKLKTTPSKLKEMLNKQNINVNTYKSVLCPELDCMLTCNELGGIEKMPEYINGLFYVQDAAAALTVEALSPDEGDTIIDMCAAPGGKCTYMAEKMNNNGVVYAFDIYEHKLDKINANAKRLGIDIIKTQISDGTVFNKNFEKAADKVLVDAPCTGLGILKRKPDIKYMRKCEDIEKLADLSLKILDNAAKYVKCGGILVFSTCTVEPAENECNIKRFLKKHSEFCLETISEIKKPNNGYITLYPNTDGTDGFFICKMRKNAL